MNGILNPSTVVKEIDLIKPENDEVYKQLDKVIKDCRKEIFFFRFNVDVFMTFFLTI